MWREDSVCGISINVRLLNACHQIHRVPLVKKNSGHKFFKISGQFQDIFSVKNIGNVDEAYFLQASHHKNFFSRQKNYEKSGH